MSISELRYGALNDVALDVDLYPKTVDELRSVILNLIDHIERLEKASHTHPESTTP